MTFEKWCGLTKQEQKDYRWIIKGKIKNQRDIEPGDLVRIAPWAVSPAAVFAVNRFRMKLFGLRCASHIIQLPA